MSEYKKEILTLQATNGVIRNFIEKCTFALIKNNSLQMKKLHVFIVKSFIGPFIATFFISVFVLLMQGLWRYSDELIGKGLDFVVIAELLFYLALITIPTAFPIAVLLSSVMTFGTLGENYELIALKAAGVSLYRIMYPLIIVVLFITGIAFTFSNNIMPVAALKFCNLYYDIRRHKPELSIKEGIFTNDMEGYSIKVDRKNNETGMMYNLQIYNHSYDNVQGNGEVTIADSGMMLTNPHTSALELILYSGKTYTDEAIIDPSKRKTFPFRRLEFEKQILFLDLPDNEFNRSDDFFMASNMMDLSQLNYTIDSLQGAIDKRQTTGANRLLATSYMKSKQTNVEKDSLLRVETQGIVGNIDSIFYAFDPDEQQKAIETALQYSRDVKSTLDTDLTFFKKQSEQVRKSEIEWHKKFTLSVACIILFFIGAPLGGIIRKGGLGMPTVVSIFLFIIYYILSMIGERSAKEGVISVIFGAWLSSLIYLPFGIFLTYKSVTDSEIMNSEAYTNFIKKIVGFFKKKRHAKA
ncbi:MAG: LptF/LptG family permease [Odoribacter sp.]|nr:LptF/LptG family permease [Odoribacter sp.]